MAHAVTPPSLAASATPRTAEPVLTPDDLELDVRSRQVWRTVLADDRLRHECTRSDSPIRHVIWRLGRSDHRHDPVEGLARMLVELAARGAAESQLRPLITLLDGVLTDCYAGAGCPGVRTLAELDRLEIVVDHLEDVAAQERHLAAVSGSVPPELLDRQAEADEAASAVLLERSRIARREARRIRQGRASVPAWASRRTQVGARRAALAGGRA